MHGRGTSQDRSTATPALNSSAKNGDAEKEVEHSLAGDAPHGDMQPSSSTKGNRYGTGHCLTICRACPCMRRRGRPTPRPSHSARASRATLQPTFLSAGLAGELFLDLFVSAGVAVDLAFACPGRAPQTTCGLHSFCFLDLGSATSQHTHTHTQISSLDDDRCYHDHIFCGAAKAVVENATGCARPSSKTCEAKFSQTLQPFIRLWRHPAGGPNECPLSGWLPGSSQRRANSGVIRVRPCASGASRHAPFNIWV